MASPSTRSPGRQPGRARTRASPRSPRTIATSPSMARMRPRTGAAAAVRGESPPDGPDALTPPWLPVGSLRDALDVLVGAGVDLDRVADPDEQRHADGRAGLDGGRLLHVAAGIAAHAGLGGGDL